MGKLDDSSGEEAPRERFRRFLKENITDAAQLRDYISECLRSSGDIQYSRALQDLVNYIGSFLGFEVSFGRYQGTPGEVGFDGLWKSPTKFDIVIEVKTTQTYAIKTKTLLDYANGLISERKISPENWIGLYVVGRPDPEVHQLENAILAEKRTHQLRVISVEALLSLAELMSEYDATHDDILGVLRPTAPNVDSVVDLMTRLVSQSESEEKETLPSQPSEEDAVYWITPIKGDEESTAEEAVEALVGKAKVYAFGERTPGRKVIKPGDWICFYATTNGVVAHARVASAPKRETHPGLRHPEKYPWLFRLDNVQLYVKNPVVIDVEMRRSLEAFDKREVLGKSWAWFVQSTHKIKKNDFNMLTGQRPRT